MLVKQIEVLTKNLSLHKQEIRLLQNENEILGSVLGLKTQDVQTSLMSATKKTEDAIQRYFARQLAENGRLQTLIAQLEGEKASLHKTLLEIQQRITEMELQIDSQ